MAVGDGGRGSGEYYKNKYGRGGSGRGRGGRGRGREGRGGQQQRHAAPRTNVVGGSSDLGRLLNQIDGKQYPAYHDIEGGWKFSDFTLYVGRAQSDPYAPPTRCRLVVPSNVGSFEPSLYRNKIRAMALADYLHRALYAHCKEMGADASMAGRGWSGPKGGDISIASPCQHVLEQTAVQVVSSGDVVAQLTINLPARGRTVLGRAAEQILCSILANLVDKTLKYASLNANRLGQHVDSIEDQRWLRSQLHSYNLAAFVKNGSILPRASGVDDHPIDSTKAIPFSSPKSLQMSFALPNSGETIQGMGIRRGITLVCGGVFHGKSTLLEAIQLGVYPKVPGDGREFCVTSPTAMKIRAEDGRYVSSVDISPFISNLPFGKDTTCFTTPDASGSTSQAANVVEAIEVGSNLLILDDDTCATNAMHRGMKMQLLVAAEKEPITPFVQKIRSIFNERNVSSILVMGGSGDFFDVADTVLMMDCYECLDVTKRAKEIANTHQSSSQSLPFGTTQSRFPSGSALNLDGKCSTRSESTISYGSVELDLSGLEQIVTKMQTNAIALSLQKVASLASTGSKTLPEVMDELNRILDERGLDVLAPEQYNGSLGRPRLLEIAGAINRFRREGSVKQHR